MMKVYLWPHHQEIDRSHGIGRVLAAQYEYLPQYGIEFTADSQSADLIGVHTQLAAQMDCDILFCHGLYWTGDPGSGQYSDWHVRANAAVIKAARSARAIVVPSQWVAEPFKRDMRINPTVIGHGIDLAQWQTGKVGDYILWNKNRAGDVCDPLPPFELARRGLPVVSTFAPIDAPQLATLRLTGKLSEADMRPLIASASVYLATTKETFGIGTLEALACGVPVLGFDWGGTRDLVDSGIDGVLVNPYDYEALIAGYNFILKHRAEMSAAAREKAARYDWSQVMPRYVELFERTLEAKRHARRGVSVIITNHNYARYVGKAIESVIGQSVPAAEIIVVDDGSTDESLSAIGQYAGQVKVIEQNNLGVAAARNAGVKAATQDYIVCLDADDALDPRFIATLKPALDRSNAIGLAYAGIKVFRDNGESYQPDWPPIFDWQTQATPHTPPQNCIPSACMFRRSMAIRAGGWLQRYAPGEDAEFWTRGLSLGYEAVRVTTEPLFWYRLHGESASRKLKYSLIDDHLPFMRDRQMPMAAPARDVPRIRSYSEPLISIVTPCAYDHRALLPDAIDSVLSQTFRNWEMLVIDDSTNDEPIELTAFPFVKVIKTRGHVGQSAARNLGTQAARGSLIVYLDADDRLKPDALRDLLAGFVSSNGRYAYGDCEMIKATGDRLILRAADYDPRVWLDQGLHAVTTLIPRAWLISIGGFDEKLNGWEESDLYTRLAIEGYHGARIDQVVIEYRQATGSVRAASFEQHDRLLKKMGRKFKKYIDGGKAMGACCGGAGTELLQAKRALDLLAREQDQAVVNDGLVKMEFIGHEIGAITYFGKKGKEYRGGNNEIERYATVEPIDVSKLESTGKWRRVAASLGA